jgi:alpha-1,3-rhamnosyl/mannosyltransferase
MKIGIDARWIFPELSGIGTHTQALIQQLAEHVREHEFILFFQHRRVMERTMEATGFHGAPNFSTRLVPYGLFSLRNQLHMPGLLSDTELDVFHSPNYMIPLRAFPAHRNGHARCVITIHDLIPLLFPDHAPKSKKARLFPLFKRIMREAARRAHIIITVSESSRQDIIRHLAIEPEREDNVVVIPNGVSPTYGPGSTQMGDPKTILYVGRFDPYKNVTRLIDAFAEVRDTSLPDARLRIIGPEDPRYPEPRLRARARGVESAIEWSGYLDDKELKQAYQDASVLVLPSRYEGFGLPVVEAMACGTPVICSNCSSLPEVAGDAAILVDPDSTPDLVEAITQILSTTALARELRRKGIDRARGFSWTHAAELTMKAYEQAAG